MEVNQGRLGSFYMSGYVLSTVASSILIHSVNQTIAPLLSAFYTFLLCIVVYNVVGIVWLKKYIVVKKSLFDIFMLNVTTAVSWITTFFSLKYIPPDLYLFFYICSMPVAATILSNAKWLRSLILSIGLCVLYVAYHVKNQWIGVCLASFGGFSGTVYSLYAARLANDFTSLEILAMRFFLTVLVTLCGVMYWKEWAVVSNAEWGIFVVLCLVCVVAPVTLYQQSIKYLPIHSVMKFIPAAPLLCYGIDVVITHSAMPILQIVALLLLSAALLL